MPPGMGLGGTGGLATPSRHFGQAYLGRTWTRTSSLAGMNSSSRERSSPIRCFDAAAAGAGLLGLGQVVLDADVGEVIQRVPAAGARLPWASTHVVGVVRLGGGGDDGLDRGVEQVEEMPLARVVDESLAAGAEDIAAEQRQLSASSACLACNSP